MFERYRRRFQPKRVARSASTRLKSVAKVLLGVNLDREMSLAASVARLAKRRGDDVALIFEGRRWSYRELDREASRRATVFYERGISVGQTVVMMLDNCPEFIFNLLALNRMGAVPALVNTNLIGDGLRHAITIVEPIAALIGAGHLENFHEALEGSEYTGLDTIVDALPADFELDSHDPGDEALVMDEALSSLGPNPFLPVVKVRGGDLLAYIYTSGTTGLPKASRVINARSAIAGVAFGGAALGLSREDTFYCCLPMFHSSALLVSFSSAIWNGATFALARKFSVSSFWDDICESEATVFVYIGEILRYLLNRPELPGDNQHKLRSIIGNGLRPEIWKQFVDRFEPGVIREFYGATEGNLNMINFTGRFGSVGRMPPLPSLNNGVVVKFDHDTQMPVRGPDGYCIKCKSKEVGELLGEIVEKHVTARFDGYADDKATDSKILRNVFKNGDLYFRSGDLLSQDWLGFFYFVDRVGDTFRWKGENVATNEVADAILLDDGVEIANVYGVALEGFDGRAGMAALLLADGVDFYPRRFYEHVVAKLPSYAHPAFIRIAGKVALTETFKLRKVDLVREGFDPDRVSDPLFVRDDERRTYLPLDRSALDQVISGKIRI